MFIIGIIKYKLSSLMIYEYDYHDFQLLQNYSYEHFAAKSNLDIIQKTQPSRRREVENLRRVFLYLQPHFYAHYLFMQLQLKRILCVCFCIPKRLKKIMSVCINVKINVKFLVVEDIYHFPNHFFLLYFFVTVTSAQISKS